MIDERTVDVRTLAIVLLAAAVGVLFLVPTASAQESSCQEILADRSDQSDGSGAPGGLLADAISDQRDEIGDELDSRSFRARLANATSAGERAAVVAAEVDRIEANLSTLEQCWGINHSEAEADRTLVELDDDERERLVNHALALRDRLNETRTEADRLPRSLRQANDVEAERFASLDQRILAVRNATAREESPNDRPFPLP